MLYDGIRREIEHYQMLSLDGMHAIDLGAIIPLIMAILWKYFECIGKFWAMKDWQPAG